jgi:hypothetical protein
MRGFHLKMFPENGTPEIEVVAAEVSLKLHPHQNVLTTRLSGLERWCESSPWRRI